jgi:hypothetical protein
MNQRPIASGDVIYGPSVPGIYVVETLWHGRWLFDGVFKYLALSKLGETPVRLAQGGRPDGAPSRLRPLFRCFSQVLEFQGEPSGPPGDRRAPAMLADGPIRALRE